ncbi:MAG: prolyl-tRNA synthetase associated domain-containing protein [Candidatus Buchananbacteria bacterium]|nr:prolyl-tRNA synthetase associated domain-containing protein [Candidatus Buchananbacteria bacterium]
MAKDLYSILADSNISYQKFDHEAVFTVDEAKKIRWDFTGAETKNLFVKNRNSDQYYLVVMLADKRADLKKLAAQLNESKLSFASPEQLKEILGLTPGSVSPFGLINDEKHQTIVVVDQEIFNFEKVGFHPNINTATLALSTDDFKKFLTSTQNQIKYLTI